MNGLAKTQNYSLYLLQGNLTFNEEDDQAFVSDNDGLGVISDLLGIEKADCSKALCYRVVAARNEVIEKGHNKDEAIYGKNAFSKVRKYNQ